MLPYPRETFEDLKKGIEKVLTGLFPIEGGNHRLDATGLRWLETSPSSSDFRDAKLRDRSVTFPLKADVVLSTDGKAVDRASNYTLLNMPSPTNLNSFVMKGKEVQIINQQRLRPGIYSRLVAGNKVESFVNTAGGNYRIYMDRDSAIFKLRLSSSHFPLYAVLRAMGISDIKIKMAWGDDVYNVNRRDLSPDDLHKVLGDVYKKLRPFTPPSDSVDERRIQVKSFFESKSMDPDVNKITLGTPFDAITAEALLAASKKALEMSKGESEADNTEDMGFKQILTYDTLLIEKFRSSMPAIKADMIRRMKRKQDIDYVMANDPFNGVLRRFFLTSEFTRYTDQNNVLDIFNTQQSITIMGEGGISSMHSVSDDLRQVHPSSIGFEDMVHTPEGGKVGLTTHAAMMSAVVDGKPAVELLTMDNKPVTVKVVDLRDKAVGFRSEFDLTPKGFVAKRPMITAKVGNVIKPVNKVDYVFSSNYGLFGLTSIGIPFADSNSPNRVMMADRHMEQAVPLKYREAPVVDTDIDGQSYSDLMGYSSAVKAAKPGVVESVSKNRIIIKQDNGEKFSYDLYHDYPLNSGAALTHTPRVKRGDPVKKGTIMATTNFHDKKGSLAMGVHLRTAYMPYKGLNFEDAVVISDTAAKKLTSEHMYTLALDVDSGTKVGKHALLTEFPAAGTFYRSPAKYDNEGVIRKGEKLVYGDMVIPAIKKMEITSALEVDRFSKLFRNSYVDGSIVWDSRFEGEVIEVVRTRTAYKVLVKTEEAMQIGDKLSVRAAAKGIVSSILPDHQMPTDVKGRPMEMLVNPGGIGGRINPGQLLEAVLGKIFFDRNLENKYVIPAFSGTDNLEMVKSEMRKHRIKDVETLYDPTDNRKKDATVGMLHTYKLKHQVRKKFNARGHGAYTTDEQPAKQQGESAQRLSSHELYALLAHGATGFMQDASMLKSQKNDQYWYALQQGLPLPPLEVPYVVDKFKTFVEGAGVHMDQGQKLLKVLPMTDKEILRRSTKAVTKPTTVRAVDFKPEPGGLYDEEITGGIGGTRWSRIDLAEPMPNPLFEKPIVALLQITAKDFGAIMEGRMGVNSANIVLDITDGNKNSLLVGGTAISQLLRAINIDTEIRSLDQKLSSASKTVRPKLEYRRKLLRALKKMGMRPDEAYINKHIAVIPPKFRQLYALDDGNVAVSDPVHGYREVLLLNNGLKDLKQRGVDSHNVADVRADLYNSIKGLVGVTEPLTRSKDFRGFVAAIKGPENKRGLFQGTVVRRTQDLTARSTVIPDAELNLDEVGLPKKMALVIYRDFVMQELARVGISALDARDMIEKATNGEDMPMVTAALLRAVEHRPVLLNRQPTLHKFGLLSFKPKLIDGEAIQTNPLVVSGFNLDYDGDTMGVHVPVSEEARIEASTKLLPSQNLFNPRDGKVVHVPSKEALLGLWLMTRPVGTPIDAVSPTAVLAKYHSREVDSNQAFRYMGQTITPGQVILSQDPVVKNYRLGTVLDKAAVMKMIDVAAKTNEDDAVGLLNKFKDYGYKYVTEIGWTVGLDDLSVPERKRSSILRQVSKGPKSFAAVARDLGKFVNEQTDNRLVQGHIMSGAFGRGDSIRQLIAAPVAVTDYRGIIVPNPIVRSYAQGLDIGSYISAIPGSRKGMMDRGLSTAETGWFSKEVMATTAETTITESDCRTHDGIVLPLDHTDIVDRVVAFGELNAGKTVTPQLVQSLRSRGKKTLKVRSPMTCAALRGLCQKCFGLDEKGQFPRIGEYIGVKAAHAITEPTMQMTLSSFHHGSSILAKPLGFHDVQQALRMPAIIAHEKVIAMKSGMVKRIEKAPAGGWFVWVEDEEHYVSPELGVAPGVHVGSKVSGGDALSEHGFINPHTLLDATGDVGKVRDAIINRLDDAYKASGINVKRRIYETVVKPMTDRSIVTDSGKSLDIISGDVIPTAEAFSLRSQGVTSNPVILPLGKAPFHSQDFIGTLTFQRLGNTLRDAASQSKDIQLEKAHPITQYVLGLIGRMGKTAEDL